ncbi:uncharacterized protein LOC110178454 [Drosophila serrata]|uniref:uncharacterized protein LOC110178454 n=1 Tax=Drosophila serrata TaxID=7274 RepID=UPI000A1D09F7|nr:uncharacterized protein LOC110178454 [Drosophila serrata]
MNPDRNPSLRKMEPLMEPVSAVQRMSSAGFRERRAVVEAYRGPQVAPDDAMLPMPPHNKVHDFGKMLQNFRQQLAMPGLWQRTLRLLKKRF